MKNIHFIPTDKPSRLQLNVNTKRLILFNNIQSNNESAHLATQNIYITNDEEIEEGDWFYDLDTKYVKIKQSWENSHLEFNGKKIILTTDEDLINDGVQAIDEDFLQWLVKNPNFENVVVKNFEDQYVYNFLDYEIIDETDHLLSQEANKKRLLQDTKEQKQHLIDMMKGDEELGLYEKPETDYSFFIKQKEEEFRNFLKKREATPEEVAEYLGFVKGAKWQQERMYSKEDLEVAFFEGQFGRYSFIDWLEQFKKK